MDTTPNLVAPAPPMQSQYVGSDINPKVLTPEYIIANVKQPEGKPKLVAF